MGLAVVVVVACEGDVVATGVLSEVELTDAGVDWMAGSEQASRPATTTPMISECRTPGTVDLSRRLLR